MIRSVGVVVIFLNNCCWSLQKLLAAPEQLRVAAKIFLAALEKLRAAPAKFRAAPARGSAQLII